MVMEVAVLCGLFVGLSVAHWLQDHNGARDIRDLVAWTFYLCSAVFLLVLFGTLCAGLGITVWEMSMAQQRVLLPD